MKVSYKEEKEMVKIYVALIKKGLRTIEQVPEKIREEVRKALEEETQKDA